MSAVQIEKVVAVVRPWCSTDEEAHALALAVLDALYPKVAESDTGLTARNGEGNHALLVGRLVGILMKDDAENAKKGQAANFYALAPRPVMKGSDYTNKIIVTQPSGGYIITVEEAPF